MQFTSKNVLLIFSSNFPHALQNNSADVHRSDILPAPLFRLQYARSFCIPKLLHRSLRILPLSRHSLTMHGNVLHDVSRSLPQDGISLPVPEIPLPLLSWQITHTYRSTRSSRRLPPLSDSVRYLRFRSVL